MSPGQSIEIRKKTPEELQQWLMHKVALHETQIDKIERAMGLAGYLSENPPILIQEHHKIVVEKLSELLTNFRIFYQKNKRYMGEWFDTKFEEFFKEMEEKHLK